MIEKKKNLTLDYRSGYAMPEWVREVIDTHLAIEAEDAKSAGALGFMARALVLATMPYKDPKSVDFVRQNGDFRLRIVAGYEGGIPFGIYPRLLVSWVATEAVRTQSPILELGDSLSAFLRDVLELRSTSGGQRGTSTRVAEQMKRLFGSLITAQYTGGQDHRGFILRNVLIAEELNLYEDALAGLENETQPPVDEDSPLWTPQEAHDAGKWKSQVQLTDKFFRECITNPVPIDLRAYKALRGSPMAMDIYTWLTYRMSYTHRRTKPIRWEALMMQFGSGYGKDREKTEQSARQAVLDFKRGFLAALKLVEVVYPNAKFDITDNGFVLLPSRPHVSPAPQLRQGGEQGNLF